jgi:hypothetical protein
VQSMVSQSLGRIVGFWDENDVFNVVLLDPLHNIWPTMATGYKVNRCSPLGCELTAIIDQIKEAQTFVCTGSACPRSLHIEGIPYTRPPDNAVILRIDDQLSNDAHDLISQGAAKSFEDLLETGIAYVMEGRPQPNSGGNSGSAPVA